MSNLTIECCKLVDGKLSVRLNGKEVCILGLVNNRDLTLALTLAFQAVADKAAHEAEWIGATIQPPGYYPR